MTSGSKSQDLLALDVYGVTRPGIAAYPGTSDFAGEIAELPQLDPVALRQTIGDLVQDRVQSRFHHVPGQMRMGLKKLFQQFRTDHCSSFVSTGHKQAWDTRPAEKGNFQHASRVRISSDISRVFD